MKKKIIKLTIIITTCILAFNNSKFSNGINHCKNETKADLVANWSENNYVNELRSVSFSELDDKLFKTHEVDQNVNVENLVFNDFWYEYFTQEQLIKIHEITSSFNIDMDYILCIAYKESTLRENIKGKDGKDHGIMQIRVGTQKIINNMIGYELNYFDMYDNIKGACILIDYLREKFDKGLHFELMSYNMGESKALYHYRNGTYSSGYSRQIMKMYENIKNSY